MWMIETVRIVESDRVTDRDKEVEYRRSGVKCQEPNEQNRQRENEGMKKTGRSGASTRLAVPPTGIEPISAEPESAILSIELRRQMELVDAKLQFF